ncbi:hypothetical protein GCM10009544_27750 [Streptomyces stramineus]|uniref:Uncharacterized protein n=1 Tax=Streptomyces stramineus TaxID=173861 RepID=A0ABN0ZZE7_9ACTN
MQCLLAAAGVGDLEAVPGEHRRQGRGDVVVVLDEQQSHPAPLRPTVWCDNTASTLMDARPVKGVAGVRGLPLCSRYARTTLARAMRPLHAECPFAAGSLCSISAQM